MLLRFVLLLAGFVAFWLPAPIQALGVCADPDYLPYSDRSGAGFENKIADAVAKLLNEPVQYTWASQRSHGGFLQFLSNTLDAKKCDVVMSIPYGSREELTTRPYYISSYVFVFDKSKNYDITSMDSPVLKRVKVGFERDTPAEDALKIRGMLPDAIAFDIADDTGKVARFDARRTEQRKDRRPDHLAAGHRGLPSFGLRTWKLFQCPMKGHWVSPEQYAFPMSMGVRTGDEALKKKTG